MTVLLSVDVESTGLDVVKDRVIEVGAILWSTTHKKCLESAGYLVKSDVPISEEITRITGVRQSAVDKFGYDSKDGWEKLVAMADYADAFIGQNVIRFDKRMLENWGKREGLLLPEKLWIDTRTDLPGVESKHLGYMCADAGFLNLFPHSALSDCQSVLKLVSMHDIDKVIERAKSPLIILKAHVSYNTNALAKKRKYQAYYENSKFQFWYKIIKELDFKEETEHGEFDVSVVDDVAVETLWYS